MRRMASAVLFSAMALAGVSATSAVAASTHAAAGAAHPSIAQAKVKTTKVHYTSFYTDEKFGPVKCKGVHITSAEYPGTATTGGADKFKCKSTTKKPLTFGKPGEKLPENFTAWASDYFNNLGHFVLAKSLNATMSSNGKAYTGFAVYPSPEEEAQKQKEKEEQEQKEKEQKEKEQKELEEKEQKEKEEKEQKELEEKELEEKEGE
jgi:hypothetical protein